MPRNNAGTYTLPNPPVVSGTTIEAPWANSSLDDIKTELTNSLDRFGRGGMEAPLLMVQRPFHLSHLSTTLAQDSIDLLVLGLK